MKTILIALASMTIGITAFAATPIDEQINKTQNFVQVGTPTYRGDLFLAFSAQDDQRAVNSRYGRAIVADYIKERATKICNLMGLKNPTAYGFAYPDEKVYMISLWETIGPDLVRGEYKRTRIEPTGFTAYFKDLVCTKK